MTPSAKTFIITLAILAYISVRGKISMRVGSIEIQNNFGKYLMLSAKEDIIITKNGTEVAIYQFREKSIINNATYRKTETAKSFIFDGLTAKLDKIFGYAG